MSLQQCQKVAHFLPAQIDHEQERGDEEGSAERRISVLAFYGNIDVNLQRLTEVLLRDDEAHSNDSRDQEHDHEENVTQH